MKRQAEDSAPIRLNDLPSDDVLNRPVSAFYQDMGPDPADQFKGRFLCEGYDSVDAAQFQKDLASLLEVQNGPPGTLEPHQC